MPSFLRRTTTKALEAVSSVGDVRGTLNQTLQLFIIHFFVLYVAQVILQVLTLLIDYGARREWYSIGIHSYDFLAATDVFLVFLFAIEIGVRIISSSYEIYMSDVWHKFDVGVLAFSVLFAIFDIGITVSAGCNMERHDDPLQKFADYFELLRDVLRLLRLARFVSQLGNLLNSPLDHFAMFAEDLADDAEEVNDYI